MVEKKLRNTGLQTVKRSGDSTHPCQNPTPMVKGRGLYLSRYGHKLLRRNAVACRPITGGRQHRTLATLPKAFHEETGRMLSRVRRSMCRRLLRTPKISQKFAGE